MNNAFIKKCNKIGVITMCIAMIFNFLPALYMQIAYPDEAPTLSQILAVWGLAAAAYGTTWITQPITFYPSLGPAGTYISNLAGSNADIRIPAMSSAQKAANVEAGTPEGDAISTIGVSSSVFVSFAMVTLFTFIGQAVIPLFPAFVKTAFTYVLPALFGAIYADMSKKNLKTGILTLIASIILFIICPSFLSSFKSLITVILGGVCARIIFVSEKKGKTNTEKK